MNVSILLEKTMKSVQNVEDEQIIFTAEDGTEWRLYHESDCCESVRVEDIVGDLADLVGAPFLMAEEISHEHNVTPDGVPTPSFQEDSFTWTFYKFATIKGSVTIRWYGTSNGYYSESVSFS